MGLMDMFAKWLFFGDLMGKVYLIIDWAIVRLCLIVNFFILFYGIGCKFSLIVRLCNYYHVDCAIVQFLPCWLCNCAIVTMLIVQLWLKVAKFAYWLCDCAKICILIVRLCENMHFDCAIVWKYAIWLCDCAIVLDCVDCVWLCGLPWAEKCVLTQFMKGPLACVFLLHMCCYNNQR